VVDNKELQTSDLIKAGKYIRLLEQSNRELAIELTRYKRMSLIKRIFNYKKK
jgi:hypothetical protein